MTRLRSTELEMSDVRDKRVLQIYGGVSFYLKVNITNYFSNRIVY